MLLINVDDIVRLSTLRIDKIGNRKQQISLENWFPPDYFFQSYFRSLSVSISLSVWKRRPENVAILHIPLSAIDHATGHGIRVMTT